jgi:RNA polymerase sigma-70 factor (ECF subfamily)
MATEKHTLNPNAWVDLHADYLFYYANSRISDTEMAKDLVQETFLSGLKAMNNFKGKASERTWLTSIIKRKVIDHYRKKNSKKGQAEIKVSFYKSGDRKGD